MKFVIYGCLILYLKIFKQRDEEFYRQSTFYSVSQCSLAGLIGWSSWTAPSRSSSTLLLRSSTYACELTTWPIKSLCFKFPVKKVKRDIMIMKLGRKLGLPFWWMMIARNMESLHKVGHCTPENSQEK